MALGVELFVEWVLSGSGWIIGDDRDRAFISDCLAQRVCGIGGIGHHDFCGLALDHAVGLRAVATLSSGQDETHRRAEASHRPMDFGTQATSRAAKGLIFRPLFWGQQRADGRE